MSIGFPDRREQGGAHFMTENRISIKTVFHRFLALPLWQRIIFALLAIGNITYYCLVFVIFKGDLIISPHDNFDSMNSWFEMFRQNGLFFSVDSPTPCFLGISTFNYAFISFSFQSLLFSLFNNFTAFSLNYIIAFFLAFIGMALLLEVLVENNTFLNLIVALLYAGLPVIPSYAIAAATIPFFFLALWHFYPTDNRFERGVSLLFLFPFFGILQSVSIFLLTIWALAAIIRTIQKHVVPVNLLMGFLLMCAGSILVEWKLFYSVLAGGPLNRSIMGGTPSYELIISSFRQYFQHGWYHVTSVQNKIILPVVIIGAILFITVFIISQLGFLNLSALRFYHKKEAGLFLWTFAAITINCFIGGLYDSHVLDNFIREIFPFLAGFNWGRFWVLNRVFWYLAFAICLKTIFYLPKCQIVALALALVQMFTIATTTNYYGYAGSTWINELIRIPRDMPRHGAYISYDDFYAAELFEQIKEDIQYSDENVAAVGYHPGVLMYNGFHCVDGYLNCYELSYMDAFRTLIAPELEQNENTRNYYDSWGGRMYLYNDDAPYEPTWTKYTNPITLRIDPAVMRDTFDLQYILSRAPIGNTDDLGLSSVGEYHTDGLYDIYVYQVIYQ